MIRFSLLRPAKLLHEDSLAPYRAEIAFGLLAASPNAGQFQLDEILNCILSNPVVHSRFLVLADRVLGGGASPGTIQRDKWFAAYLLSPAKWEDEIPEVANLRPGVIFEIRDRGDYGRLPYGPRALIDVAANGISRKEQILRRHRLSYPCFQQRYKLLGCCRRGLTNFISAMPSQAATDALVRLEPAAVMASYKPHVRHALANQDFLR